jgi:hypothetical protein
MSYRAGVQVKRFTSLIVLAMMMLSIMGNLRVMVDTGVLVTVCIRLGLF